MGKLHVPLVVSLLVLFSTNGVKIADPKSAKSELLEQGGFFLASTSGVAVAGVKRTTLKQQLLEQVDGENPLPADLLEQGGFFLASTSGVAVGGVKRTTLKQELLEQGGFNLASTSGVAVGGVKRTTLKLEPVDGVKSADPLPADLLEQGGFNLASTSGVAVGGVKRTTLKQELLEQGGFNLASTSGVAVGGVKRTTLKLLEQGGDTPQPLWPKGPLRDVPQSVFPPGYPKEAPKLKCPHTGVPKDQVRIGTHWCLDSSCITTAQIIPQGKQTASLQADSDVHLSWRVTKRVSNSTSYNCRVLGKFPHFAAECQAKNYVEGTEGYMKFEWCDAAGNYAYWAQPI